MTVVISELVVTETAAPGPPGATPAPVSPPAALDALRITDTVRHEQARAARVRSS